MAVLRKQWRASLAVVALIAGILFVWQRPVAGHTSGDEVISISIPTTFASLDNGIHDADPTVGVVEIDGNLTIASGGSITCDESGTAASACPITLNVTKDLEIQAGGSIHAENLGANGGKGGDIKITVGGNFTMRGPNGLDAGAFISSRNFSDRASHGGKITIVVRGVTLDTSVDPAVGVYGSPIGDILVVAGTTIVSASAPTLPTATAPPLGTAARFAVLGGSAVTNTGPSVVTGDLGVWPGTAITGFPPGIVNGTIHDADAVAQQAQSDVTTAYNNLAGQACNTNLTGQDLGGLTLTAGVYCFSSSAQLTGTLTLDAQGDPNAVFIFQIGSTLTTASNSTVKIINGGSVCNVFWQVGSSATLGTTTTFVGNILALTSITLNTGANISGRALAQNGAVTMDTNNVSNAGCTPGPSPTPTSTGTSGPSPTPTRTATSSPSPTPTRTGTSGPSPTPTRTATSSPSPTPTPTPTTTTSLLTPTATPTPGFCNKLPVQQVLAGRVPDVIVRTDLNQSIQAAVNGASDTNGDGFIIVGVVSNGGGVLGGSTHQSVVISQVYSKPFLLFGCSVTMIDPAPGDANPTGWIKSSAGSPGNIFVMDLHGSGSGVAGWKVEGNGRTLRNVGNSTSGVGAWFVGNNNTMHNGSALHNTGVGVRINGDGNVVTDTLVEFNGGNGIEVHGNNNRILKTQLGDVSGRGNLGDGLNVSGNGNLLSENTARANSLDGIHVVTGTGNTLTKNLSGGTSAQDNGDCEYDVAAGNTNGGENKANGVTVVGSPFPTGCIGTP